MLDQYIALESEYKALGKKIENLKNTLTEYAVTHDFTRLYGDGASVGIQSRDNRSIPSDLAEQAEQYLRDQGLWDELQSLDRYALARAVKARDLDEMVEQ
jgi:hypothetical protein